MHPEPVGQLTTCGSVNENTDFFILSAIFVLKYAGGHRECTRTQHTHTHTLLHSFKSTSLSTYEQH